MRQTAGRITDNLLGVGRAVRYNLSYRKGFAMPRLDQHVATVQNKLALGRFLHALAWGGLGLAGVALLGVLIWFLTQYAPPKPIWWIGGGAAAVLVGSIVYAMIRRPTPHDAAVAIDVTLGLKEKFSTALYARRHDDPFSQAAVRDAEQTAENVSLHKRFPIAWPPRPIFGTVAIALLAFVLSQLLTPLDLMGKKASQAQQLAQAQQQAEVQRVLRDALVQVRSIAHGIEDSDKIRQAERDLQELLANPPQDIARANRSALKALQDTQDAIKQQIEQSQSFAQAEQDRKLFQGMIPPSQQTGPVADARRAMARGDFSQAIDDLKELAENFDKLDEEQKDQVTQQMQQMAQALQQMAQDPKMQEQVQQQLQQAGATQQQAQQMQQLMQQAAQGNQQAAQQLQQMGQQLMQQAAANQGLNQQQVQAMQQAIQQAMQQGQAGANAQQQATQMAQAAQQMAQAMQQANQQGQGQQGQNQQQQMAQAQQQMQQQLQAMQAAQNDMQQVQAAQQAAQQAAADAAAACDAGGDGQGQGQGQQPGQGQWAGGEGQNQGGGMGGPGQGRGGQAQRAQAPFTVKQEHAPSHNQEDGRLLASFLVKDPEGMKGESRQRLRQVVESAQSQATDEVETERVSRQSRQAVRSYFGSLADDTE